MCIDTATPPKAYSRRGRVVSHPKTEPLALADTVVYRPVARAPRCCGEGAAWFRQSALLAGIPRCPTCLAAHAMMWSGIAVSLCMAVRSWLALPVLAVVYVLYLATKSVRYSSAMKPLTN